MGSVRSVPLSLLVRRDAEKVTQLDYYFLEFKYYYSLRLCVFAYRYEKTTSLTLKKQTIMKIYFAFCLSFPENV